MKIQLDTDNKTITIEEDVNIYEFYEQINGILPGGVWREFTLKVTKITEWKDPITLPHTSPFNPDPWTIPNTPGTLDNPIWYTTNTDVNATVGVDGVELNTGTYNLDIS